jgi:hypothetical protein
MDTSDISHILQYPINTPVKIQYHTIDDYGIVVGYAKNELNEVVISVQLIRKIDDEPIIRYIHPTYLTKLVDKDL